MIKWIVIAIVSLIVLGYLGVDIRKAVQAPASQSNLEYAKEVSLHVWNNYLKEPAKFIWREIIVNFVWDPLINLLNKKVKGEVSSARDSKDPGAFLLSILQPSFTI